LVQAYINGIAYEAENDFKISEKSGNKTSSSISVLVNGQPFPKAGDIIEVKDGDTTIFWGTCGIPKTPKFKTGHEALIYSIKCGNANDILSYRIINVAYQGYTVTQIVRAIFDQYVSAEGITLGEISQTDITVDVYTAKDMNLQDALNELADLVGAIWRIDENRKFYFIGEEDFPAFPRQINQNFLLGTELQQTTKNYKQRTVQYISGATETTSTQTEHFTMEKDQNTFVLSFPLAERPQISINGVAVPPEKIGINGIDSTDPNLWFMFSYNSANVNVGQGDFIKEGDEVTFVYIGIFPIRVTVTNDPKISEIAALTGTSGRREFVQLANNVTSIADATQLGLSLLQQFEEATGEVKFWLLSSQLYALGMTLDDTALLTKMSFNLPEIGITGDYVITERDIEPYLGDLENDFEQKLKIKLKLVNRDYIKSYGETISSLRRDINQLSIREDDTVINSPAVSETVSLTEILYIQFNRPYYPTTIPQAQQLGGLFAPLELGAVYPG
jgi:hypothetical protein